MKNRSQRESTFLKELDELLRRNEALKVSSNGIQGYAVGNTVITKYCLENAPFSCSTQKEVFDANVSHHWKENANNKANQIIKIKSKIESKDIIDIIYALCIAKTDYELKLKQAVKNGHKGSEHWHRKKIADINKGFDAVVRIRKDICLADDPIFHK